MAATEHAGVRRRALVRGAVWSLPVVAVAAPAPAFAASCTSLYDGTLNWASAAYTRTDATHATGTITEANGLVTTLTLLSTFTNYTDSTTNTDNTANLGVTALVGGTGGSGLTLCQTANTNGALNSSANRQALRFTFNRSVSNVRFTFTDVDSGIAQYNDAVAITNATFTSTIPTGSTVSGTGAIGSPFTQTNTNLPSENVNGTGGNVSILVPGPVTTFTVLYWNRQATTPTNGTKQTIFISNLSAAVYNSGCP